MAAPLGKRDKRALKFSLTNMINSLKVADQTQFNKVRKSFVDRCMELLQTAHSHLVFNDQGSPVYRHRIDRLVTMLRVCNMSSCTIFRYVSTHTPFGQTFLKESRKRDDSAKKAVVAQVRTESVPIAVAAPKSSAPQARKVLFVFHSFDLSTVF